MKQAITSNLFQIYNVSLRTLLACIRSYIKSVLRYKFQFRIPNIRTLYIYVSKDVRIRSYFSKPKGVREQKRLGNTVPGNGSFQSHCRENYKRKLIIRYQQQFPHSEAATPKLFG
jgi:hypothetical protein